jgi:hypothetical protein
MEWKGKTLPFFSEMERVGEKRAENELKQERSKL